MDRLIRTINLGSKSGQFKEYLNVGFLQTVVDEELAWEKPSPSIRMNRIAEIKAWQDIRDGFISLKDSSLHPDIIVLPELAIPHGYIDETKKLAKAMGSVIIGGLDFELVNKNKIRNRAIIIVPQYWPDISIRAKKISTFYVGKTFFSDKEKSFFEIFNSHELPDPTTYIFNAGDFGEIGFAICSDFFDIERFVIYRGKIHHMLIISHNRDTNSYYFLAEAISRLVYCNVIICNTGFYGDSLAFAPYKESYERFIYRHRGKNLFSTQVVKLPVQELELAQQRNDNNKKFISCPPGYFKS